MSISRTSWDRWAPMAYVFIIGLVLGFVIGFAMGILNVGRPAAIYFLLLPAAMIVIAFIVFTAMARRIDKRA